MRSQLHIRINPWPLMVSLNKMPFKTVKHSFHGYITACRSVGPVVPSNFSMSYDCTVRTHCGSFQKERTSGWPVASFPGPLLPPSEERAWERG